MTTSRSMVVTQPGRMEMREFQLPLTGPDDGLLKAELECSPPGLRAKGDR
jgi:hypothetical protein